MSIYSHFGALYVIQRVERKNRNQNNPKNMSPDKCYCVSADNNIEYIL